MEALRTVCPPWLMDAVLVTIEAVVIDPLASLLILEFTLRSEWTMDNFLAFKDFISESNAIVETNDEVSATDLGREKFISNSRWNVVLTEKFIQDTSNEDLHKVIDICLASIHMRIHDADSTH